MLMFLTVQGRSWKRKQTNCVSLVTYCTTSKGYRRFDENTKRVIKSRDVTFNETDFDAAKHTEVVNTDTESDMPEKEAVNVPQEVQEVRRSGRECRPPLRYVNEYADTAKVNHVAYRACEIIEPNSIEEAFTSDHAKEWKITADSEYEALMEWELVKLPGGREAIGCKWAFNIKYTSSGQVERFEG